MGISRHGLSKLKQRLQLKLKQYRVNMTVRNKFLSERHMSLKNMPHTRWGASCERKESARSLNLSFQPSVKKVLTATEFQLALVCNLSCGNQDWTCPDLLWYPAAGKGWAASPSHNRIETWMRLGSASCQEIRKGKSPESADNIITVKTLVKIWGAVEETKTEDLELINSPLANKPKVLSIHAVDRHLKANVLQVHWCYEITLSDGLPDKRGCLHHGRTLLNKPVQRKEIDYWSPASTFSTKKDKLL